MSDAHEPVPMRWPEASMWIAFWLAVAVTFGTCNLGGGMVLRFAPEPAREQGETAP